MRTDHEKPFLRVPSHLLAVFILLVVPAVAQTSLSGQVFDGSGGPLLTGEVYHTTGFTVPTGQTLTIQPGAMLKCDGATVGVVGTLVAVGTALEPIRVTSIFDDSVGGDTNGDGASMGTPGDWRGFSITTAGTASFEHVELRYGGGSGTPPIAHFNGTWSATSCTFSDSLEEAIDLRQVLNLAPITDCTFLDNGTYPIEGASIDALGIMSGNTASGNGSGDYVPVRDGTTAADVTIGPDNLLSGALVFGVAAVPFQTLTLEAGVVVKWLDTVLPNNRHFRVEGNLITRGTKDDPVVITSFADDAHGGDTNGDGPSSGAPGDWAGVSVRHSARADLEHTLLRFGGAHPSWPPVSTINGGAPELRLSHVTIEGALEEGMALSVQGVVDEVASCEFLDNGTYPVDGLSFAQLESFRENKASGHGTADAFRVTHDYVDTEVTITPRNYPGDVLILSRLHHVRATGSLTLERGVVLKAEASDGLDVLQAGGTLHLRGTAFEPVVLTAIEDDTIGGDTNKDGSASTPTPGSTGGFRWLAGTFGSAENALSRYATDGFRCLSSDVSLRSVRADFASMDGIEASAHAGAAMNWVAFDCNWGIRVGDDYDVYHATCVDNDSAGIVTGSGTTGLIVNTICWDNGDDYALSGTHTVHFSIGVDDDINGINDNLSDDPFFVGQGSGDLRLLAGSPAVDSADSVTAMQVVKDHDEHSRILDPNLTGTALPDRGAYERHIWNMTVEGQPYLGGAQRFRVEGPAGTSIYMVGVLDGHTFFDPQGFRTCGTFSVFNLGRSTVGRRAFFGLPYDPSLVGIEFGVQTLTWPLGNPSLGAFTNLYRGVVLPFDLQKTFKPFNRGLIGDAGVVSQ